MKSVKKPRRWKCQGIVNTKPCKNYALLETKTHLTNGEFAIPITVKLCMPCDLKSGALLPKMKDVSRHNT